MTSPNPTEPKTFTAFLRRLFAGWLNGIAGFFQRIGLKPNTITIIGVVGNVLAGVLIAFDKLTWGGLVAMLVGPLDALDGSLARLRGKRVNSAPFLIR